MKRRLLQFCFALGLLLTLPLAFVFVRGFWASETWGVEWERLDGDHRIESSFHVETSSEQLAFQWNELLSFDAAAERKLHKPLFTHARGYRSLPRFPGTFSYSRTATGKAFDRDVWVKRTAQIPMWFVLTTFALLTFAPGWLLWRARRERLRRCRGLCPTCGYDLRGANHERCPECGTGIEAARV